MTTDEWNALLNRLTEVWEHFANAIRQAADALTKIFERITDEKEKHDTEKTLFVPRCKKSQYLKNHTPIYKVQRKNQKHLPYQRRNF